MKMKTPKIELVGISTWGKLPRYTAPKKIKVHRLFPFIKRIHASYLAPSSLGMEDNIIKIIALYRRNILSIYYANEKQRDLVISVNGVYYTLTHDNGEIASHHTYYDIFRKEL